jgi:hypothetical protein
MRAVRDSERALRGSGTPSMRQKRFLPSWWRVVLQAAVLVLAAAWIYSPVYHGEFLWDDHTLITDNWMVQSGSLGGLAAIWTEPDGPDYFPLTYTAMWIQWIMFGDDPTGYHLTTIALHALSGLLLWALLAQLKLPGSWLAAVVFTVHPVCVESVAWISEIKNTLSLPFFLLSCLFWVKQDDSEQTRASSWWYTGSIITFLLAMLAKPSMVGLPLLTLLYAWWKRQRIAGHDLKRMAPLFLLALVMGLVTVWFQHERGIREEVLPAGGAISRIAIAGIAVVFYAISIVWPVGLIPVYPQWSAEPVQAWHMLPWLGLALVGYVSWQFRSTWGKHVIFATGFFLLMVAPVLGFVDMSFMRISWVSDHFLYLPMIGPIACLVCGAVGLSQSGGETLSRLCFSIITMVSVVLGAASFQDAKHWRTSHDLWSHTAALNPNAWPAYVWLGDEQFEAGHFENASRLYAHAAEISPLFRSMARYRDRVIEILLRQRRYSEAIDIFDKKLKGSINRGSDVIPEGQTSEKTHSIEKAKKVARELLRDGCEDQGLQLVLKTLENISSETSFFDTEHDSLLQHNEGSKSTQEGH